MTTEEIELKPCPFCGGDADLVATGPSADLALNDPSYVVECVGCHASGTLCIGSDKPEVRLKAAECWNRRIEPIRGWK